MRRRSVTARGSSVADSPCVPTLGGMTPAGVARAAERITALLFDLDGVVTQTAKVHAAAWKELFDAVLAAHGIEEPFSAADYARYVDGRLHHDGVRTFLASRGITLPEGSPEDPPAAQTVHGLGNRKNLRLLEILERDGVERYEGSVRFLDAARAAGFGTAVVSTEALGAAPGQAAVFEDAVAGVEAGRAGGFGWVVGVDRVGNLAALLAAGADVVVEDLSELQP